MVGVLLFTGGCASKGTVIKNDDPTGQNNRQCTLVIRPDGVDENGNARVPYTLKRTPSDCKRCHVNERWPACMSEREQGHGHFLEQAESREAIVGNFGP